MDKEEILKWCGLENKPEWQTVDRPDHYFQLDLWEPDMNFYFKYAAPKLREHLKDEYLGFSDFLIIWIGDVLDGKDPTEAFGECLEKLISAETKRM